MLSHAYHPQMLTTTQEPLMMRDAQPIALGCGMRAAQKQSVRPFVFAACFRYVCCVFLYCTYTYVFDCNMRNIKNKVTFVLFYFKISILLQIKKPYDQLMTVENSKHLKQNKYHKQFRIKINLIMLLKNARLSALALDVISQTSRSLKPSLALPGS